MTDPRITVRATGDFRRLNGDLSAMERRVGQFGRRFKQGLGIAGVGGFAALAKSAVDAEREFSLTMRTIQANTGATAAEIDKMGKLAVDAGGKMGFSARESAGAMLELAKAGLDTKTIIGGGLAGTLKLAAAGGTSLATASTIAANAMNAFSLAGKDMDSIAAALAGGANASTASVESLGIALSQVGPGATTAGLSLQETVAALAAFDNAGIKGSDSGTSLKTMLTRLVPATKAARQEADRLGLDFTKADGSFVSLEQMAGRLKRALGGLSAEQRTTALRIIFGSDATRAATVLMREGSRGIRKYIEATKDQDAAQKAVNARTSGTEGAMKRLSAAVERAKLKVGQELAPAVTKGADAFGDKLVPAIDSGIKAGRKIAQALAPAASEITEALGHLAGEGDSAGKMFDEVFIPALETTAKAVGALVNFVDELPGPIKEIGAQAAIAALILPRLAAGAAAVGGAFTAAGAGMSTFAARIAQNRAAMTYQTTLLGKAREAMVGFGGTARAVAGVGGFLALTQGATSSNKAISALSSTAGGAAIGFSVGGPWGAAIGGAAGLLIGLKKATQESDEAAKVSKTTWETYAATLDDVTGATTRATKAMIIQDLQQSDLLKLANQFDVSQQTIVNGILGQSKARERLNQIIKEQQDAIAGLESDPRFNEQSTTGKELQQEASDRRKLVESIKAETGELREGLKTKAQELALLNNIPERVATKIQAEGADLTARQIGRLASAYNLTPKQIRTVIKLSGTDATKADVDRIKARLDSVSDVDAGRKWANRFTKEIQGARPKASAEINGLKGLLGGAGDVKPSFTKFNAGLSGGINSAKGTARSGGYQVGVNLGDGFSSGVQSRASILAAIARNTVLGAISVANKAADIRSPSRKTRYTGEMLGAGMEAGLRARQGAVRKAGKTLAQAVLAGVDDGADGVSKSIEKITAAVRKAITGKNQGKREAAYLKTLRDEFAALRANGRQQDVVAGKLERARDRLKELTDEYRDYARAIRDTVTATGDVTQLGRQDDGTVVIKSLLTELTGKVLGAERFEVLIAKLAKDGLSKTSIQQLLDQGPEAALATAEAIAAGGAASIKEINALQDRLAKSGDRLGDLMADRYYGAGVDAAKGIVKGLEAQAKSLDRAAVRMANELVKAVKRALGIKSPSREFRSIADQVTEGLTLQLQSNGTYVKRSGAVMAAQLVKGFDVPTLSADVLAGGAASSQPVKLDITITSPAVDQLTQGKRMQATLDYARSNGVRGVTF